MKRLGWTRRLFAVIGVALVAAAAAAALPDDPYQRWQGLENTLYANATWSYERIHFDPAPVDVAILGASRTLMGLSAPEIAARLAAAGQPLTVANLSVIEAGRNLEWAVADELFKAKRPKVVVVMIGETVHRWGHPGFKYIAPAAAVVAPPAPLLHNYLADLAYLPYRQMTLFAARLAPGLAGVRDRFDAAGYVAKPVDYSQSQTLADGKRLDMDGNVTAADLIAGRRKFARSRHESRLPAAISRFTDIDDPVYVEAIHRLAASHGARLIFVFLPEYGGATTIQDRAFYAARGRIADDGDLSRDAGLFQSFAHLNRRGAVIASDRLAAIIAAELAVPAESRIDAASRTTA